MVYLQKRKEKTSKSFYGCDGLQYDNTLNMHIDRTMPDNLVLAFSEVFQRREQRSLVQRLQ